MAVRRMSAAEAARAVFEDSGSELEGFDSQEDGKIEPRDQI